MKMRKMLSFLLALVMAVSLTVPAFAAEGDAPEKELHWVHLDGDENGKFSASADALKNDDPGHGNSTEYDPSRGDVVLFFIWNNETHKREGYVVPTAGDGMAVEKLPVEAIASGAKQSQYYVTLRMNKFQDSEVTANGLSFHVTAKLGNFGFYSAATPSADTILVDEVAAADLTGGTLYFCNPYAGTGEEKDRDSVVKVEKDPNLTEPNKFYDLEKVKDGLWKITINDVGKIALQNGGFPVTLGLEVKQPDGNTRQDGRNIFIQGEDVDQGPQLIFADLAAEWDDAAGHDLYFVNRNYGGEAGRMQVHAGYERTGIFGTVKDGEDPFTDHGLNWNAFTPVDVNSLKVPSGLTVESLADQARKGENWAKYFVRLTVAENGKEYTVTSGDYTMTVGSDLPELGVYTAATASFDTWAGEYEFPYHPAKAENVYYIISTATDNDGLNNRHLTGLKLSTANLGENCGNNLVALEKVSDNVYKLTIKNTSERRFHVELDPTWTDFAGNTWTDTNWGFGDFWLAPFVVASETKLTDKYDEFLPYSEFNGKVTTSVTMDVGAKEVYLYTTPVRPDGMTLRAYSAENAALFCSNDKALTISSDKNDPSKFTLNASKAGTYDIFIGQPSWDEVKLFHADGTPYTAKETEAWHDDPSFYVDTDSNGKMIVWGLDQDYTDAVPFEEYFDGDTCEIIFGDVEDVGFQHLTVTVGGGGSVADLFADVKANDWFVSAVQYVYNRGLMKGTDKGFEPRREVYNTELLQILWNLSGNPKADASVSTAAGQWYAGAVDWAASVKLIDGSAFAGQGLINRGEVRKLMDDYGKLVGKDYSNLFKGNENGDLMLDKTLTRCELAQVLMNAQA